MDTGVKMSRRKALSIADPSAKRAMARRGFISSFQIVEDEDARKPAEVDEAATAPGIQDRRQKSKRHGDQVSRRVRQFEPLPDGVSLTLREAQVLHWVALGKSDWQMGKILQISPKTVNYHAENAKKKLGVASRAQAAVRADRAGLLDAIRKLAIAPAIKG
jgi:DNA-binding CsgD family transcriptional regulator